MVSESIKKRPPIELQSQVQKSIILVQLSNSTFAETDRKSYTLIQRIYELYN